MSTSARACAAVSAGVRRSATPALRSAAALASAAAFACWAALRSASARGLLPFSLRRLAPPPLGSATLFAYIASSIGVSVETKGLSLLPYPPRIRSFGGVCVSGADLETGGALTC